MSAATAFPSLSQLLAWSTEHLTEAADFWTSAGDRCYYVANQVWRDSLAVDWQGVAADALRSDTHADMLTTSAVADQLHAAGKVARRGASDLSAAHSRIRYAVDDARAADFTVTEDLSVTDRLTAESPAQRTARQVQAHAFAMDIRQRAMQLVGLDEEVAGKIITAVAGIRTAFPQNTIAGAPPKSNLVRAVDWKQDPAPVPPPSLGADDIRRVLEKLPRGNKSDIREVRSQEDLDNLWKWMRAQGVERSEGYGKLPGEMRQLPDGTIVGRREAAGSTKMPALDIRVPDGGGYLKVHINPTRGGVPDILAPIRPATPEPARTPFEPRPVAPPPVQSTPRGPGPAPPFGGGGPVPPESVPHPVQPPHSHHGLPVLGKDELPDLDEFGQE